MNIGVFVRQFVVLVIGIILGCPYLGLSKEPLSAEVVQEMMGGLWAIAAPDVDIFSEDEMRAADAKWQRIAEIGEETASRALIVLYQQKAGVDRPLTQNPVGPPEKLPTSETYTFDADSVDKSRISRMLARDPRMVEEFLPVIRKRLLWMIGHVPHDKPPTEINGMEVWAMALYMLQWGTESDKALLAKLQEEYGKSSLPTAAGKQGSIDSVRSNLEMMLERDRKRPPPFIRLSNDWVRPPGWDELPRRNSGKVKAVVKPNQGSLAAPIEPPKPGAGWQKILLASLLAVAGLSLGLWYGCSRLRKGG